MGLVVGDGLGLDEGVDLGIHLGVARVDALEVRALAQVQELPLQVQADHELLVVEHPQAGVVAAGALVGIPAEGPDVVGCVPDVGEVVRAGLRAPAARVPASRHLHLVVGPAHRLVEAPVVATAVLADLGPVRTDRDRLGVAVEGGGDPLQAGRGEQVVVVELDEDVAAGHGAPRPLGRPTPFARRSRATRTRPSASGGRQSAADRLSGTTHSQSRWVWAARVS